MKRYTTVQRHDAWRGNRALLISLDDLIEHLKNVYVEREVKVFCAFFLPKKALLLIFPL